MSKSTVTYSLNQNMSSTSTLLKKHITKILDDLYLMQISEHENTITRMTLNFMQFSEH